MTPPPFVAPERFRTTSAMAFSAVAVAAGLFLVYEVIRYGSAREVVLTVIGVVGALALVYATAVRPVVSVDPRGVTLRNVARDVHVPWAAVTGLAARWSFTVCTDGKEFRSWALPATRRTPVRTGGRLLGSYGEAPIKPKIDAAHVRVRAGEWWDRYVAGGVAAATPATALETWSRTGLACSVGGAVLVVAALLLS